MGPAAPGPRGDPTGLRYSVTIRGEEHVHVATLAGETGRERRTPKGVRGMLELEELVRCA